MVPDLPKETRLPSESKASAYCELMFIDANERWKHFRCIERIADEMQRSVAEVAPIYEEVLEHLIVQARIKDYLWIITSKNVKNILDQEAR